MEQIIQQIEDIGLKVNHYGIRYLWVTAKRTIVRLDSHELFGLEEDDFGLRIKQIFYINNIKIDLYNPDNNRSTSSSKKKHKSNIILSVSEKKLKIRELLKNKYKLL